MQLYYLFTLLFLLISPLTISAASEPDICPPLAPNTKVLPLRMNHLACVMDKTNKSLTQLDTAYQQLANRLTAIEQNQTAYKSKINTLVTRTNAVTKNVPGKLSPIATLK
ncbi:hypothetical protein TI05_00865 [Achromatium sp. WMS3]|nr:hypothetical protein TI05_00865 [Achromatium sp. WMS3]